MNLPNEINHLHTTHCWPSTILVISPTNFGQMTQLKLPPPTTQKSIKDFDAMELGRNKLVCRSQLEDDPMRVDQSTGFAVSVERALTVHQTDRLSAALCTAKPRFPCSTTCANKLQQNCLPSGIFDSAFAVARTALLQCVQPDFKRPCSKLAGTSRCRLLARTLRCST